MKRMKLLVVVALALTICLPGVGSAGMFIFDETAFQADINPGYYLEDFNSVTAGAMPGSLSYGPVNGFSYTISASVNSLYTLNQSISTNDSTASLKVNFTGSPVTAVGGLFYPTDFDGNVVSGDIILGLSNGDTVDFLSSSSLPFVGYSASPGDGFITSLSVNAVASDTDFPTIDHLYVGTQVPLPPSVLLLGTGLLGLVGWRRFRKG